ncbi:MAG: hypothetical protein ACI84K_000163 [Pseudohongiellaceae bacterium]|jgi:hypothetical protein
MTLLSIIFSVVFVITFAVLIYQRIQKNKLRTQLDKFINLVEALKKVLMIVQMHRGFTTTYLNHNQEFKDAIDEMKTLSDKLWSQMSSEHTELTDDPLFIGLLNHWERLKVRWVNQTVDNNIEQHNRLIINLLCLLDNQVKENASFVNQGGINSITVLWRLLLETIESIAQTRIIGNGIISNRKSKKLDRNKLNYLMARTKFNLNQLNDSRALFENINGMDSIEDNLLKSTQNAEHFFEFVLKLLLKDTAQNYSTEQLYDISTEVIEPLNQLFDRTIELLKGGDMYKK